MKAFIDYALIPPPIVPEEMTARMLAFVNDRMNTLLTGYVAWVALQDPASPHLAEEAIFNYFASWWRDPLQWDRGDLFIRTAVHP